MKIVFPDYFNKFRCIAGDCPDTCCSGWEIVVDSESVKKYSNIKSDFRNTLVSRMCKDSDGDVVFLSDNGRCPFLNANNLCDIYIKCGEEYLCNTCKMFPRFLEEYGSLRETGLGMACPEAARIILEEKDMWNFVSENNDEIPLPNDIEPELYFCLIQLRKKLFEIIFNKSIPFADCLNTVADMTEMCQHYIDKGEYEKINSLSVEIKNHGESCFFGKKSKKILLQLEILSKEWHNIICSADFNSTLNFTEEFRNIAAYYIYRYFLKALYDKDVLSKIKLCVFSCEVISRVTECGLNVVKAAQLYSKEAEYSAENIKTIYSELYN